MIEDECKAVQLYEKIVYEKIIKFLELCVGVV